MHAIYYVDLQTHKTKTLKQDYKIMSTLSLYANPYNIDAMGFYFSSLEEYETKAKNLSDRYGNAVEEFEIDFINGDESEQFLFDAVKVNQSNLDYYFDCVNEYSFDEGQILAGRYLRDCGHTIESILENIDNVQIFEGRASDYAYEIVNDCYNLDKMMGDLVNYFDYDKYAVDLIYSGDIVEVGYNFFITNPNDF